MLRSFKPEHECAEYVSVVKCSPIAGCLADSDVAVIVYMSPQDIAQAQKGRTGRARLTFVTGCRG